MQRLLSFPLIYPNEFKKLISQKLLSLWSSIKYIYNIFIIYSITKKLRTISAILTILLALLAVVGTFFFTVIDGTSIYNVTASVEQVRVKNYGSSKASWYLNQVEITYPCLEDHEDGCTAETYDEVSEVITEKETPDTIPKFTGSLQIACNTELIFTRIGVSDMTIQLRPLTESEIISGKKWNDQTECKNIADEKLVGDLLDDSDEFFATIREFAIIKIRKINGRYKNGESLFFNISGDIHLADTKDYPDSHIKPVLIAGEISILEKSFLLDENYLIGPYKLDLGDSIDMVGQEGSSEGFLMVEMTDSSTGLKTVFSTEAEKSTISRYKFDGYELSASIWNRLFHDRILGYLWMLFTFLFSLTLFFHELSLEEKN